MSTVIITECHCISGWNPLPCDQSPALVDGCVGLDDAGDDDERHPDDHHVHAVPVRVPDQDSTLTGVCGYFDTLEGGLKTSYLPSYTVAC